MLEALERQVEAHIHEMSEHLGLIRYKIGLYREVLEQVAEAS
jgi:hypothetical protein